jgi:hypothetical protein
MAKVPGKEYFLKVGNYKVSVKFITDGDLIEAWDDNDNDGCEPLGICRHVVDGYQILINQDLKNPLKPTVFYHEVFELINSMYDMELSHQTITTLGVALAQIEADNKKVLDEIR